MTAETRKFLRIALLRAAAASRGNGLTLALCTFTARTLALRIATEDVEEEVQYLVDKDFLEKVSSAISPEVRAWRITAAGRDWLATEGYE